MADQEQQSASTVKPKKVRKKRVKASKAASRKKVAKAKRRGPGRPMGSKNKVSGATAKRTGGRKRRTRYSPAEREKILAAAGAEGLTAVQVQKRFGVTPVTYYSWRKKAGKGAGPRIGRPPGNRGVVSNGALDQQLRAQVQARIRALLPSIIDSEIAAYFGGGSKRQRRK
jgi:transposase-like protein